MCKTKALPEMLVCLLKGEAKGISYSGETPVVEVCSEVHLVVRYNQSTEMTRILLVQSNCFCWFVKGLPQMTLKNVIYFQLLYPTKIIQPNIMLHLFSCFEQSHPCRQSRCVAQLHTYSGTLLVDAIGTKNFVLHREVSGASGIFPVGVLSTTWLRFQSFSLLQLAGRLSHNLSMKVRGRVGRCTLISVHHGFSVMVKNT